MDSPLVKSILRIFAIGMIVIIFILTFSIAILSLRLTSSGGEFNAVAGKADIESLDLTEHPVFLNGEWEVFPDVYLSGETANEALLQNGQSISFPIGSLTKAQGTATYRLTLNGEVGEDVALYLPNLKVPVNVYYNGVLQPSLGADATANDYLTLNSIFPLSSVGESEENEIILSVEQAENETALYKRWVVVGTLGGLMMLSQVNMANTTLVLGLLGILLLSGFIFMTMRPGHKMITLITLFDSMLIFRIVFGLPELSSFMHAIFPSFYISDRACLSLQIFFLMLGGIMGSLLANQLFDPGNKIPRFLTLPFPVLYMILAVLLPLNIPFFEQYGILCILVIYVLTFVVVFLQYLVYWKREAGFYAAFQIFKTTYVGFLIFFDILFMNTKTHFLIFTYLYIIFFFAHLFIRLYDNNMSYRDVEHLNQNLEKTVQERTNELTEANRILSELSTRDPLTGTHNRLYMEQVMESALANPAEADDKVYLCMFDLDHFKRINDLHGHDVGDEQLKYVVHLVTEMIPPGAVLARMGGEEFMILYRDFGSREVLENVEDIRKAIEADAKVDPKHTTASFGIAKYRGDMTRKDLLKLSDRCLYKAKHMGRNRAVWALSAQDEIAL